MNYISDVLFWISNGLLVPVVVLLILFFLRSLLLIGNFFGTVPADTQGGPPIHDQGRGTDSGYRRGAEGFPACQYQVPRC